MGELKLGKQQFNNIKQKYKLFKGYQNYNKMGGKSPNQVRKVNHFFFGDVVKKKSFNKDVICVTRPIMSKQQFDEWKEKYDRVHSMNKDSLFVPQDYQYRQISTNKLDCRGCCGADHESEMTYEDVDFSLHSEILNRKQRSKSYTESELMYLLYRLLQGGKEFQKNSMHFGDIRTRNILITRSSEVKMINVASFPNEKTNVQRVIDGFDNSTIFYLAPEQVQYVRSRGSAKTDFPNPKTQAWSIGLCALEAATLECSQQIYEMPSRKINENLLNSRLKSVQQKYPTLYVYLSKILTIDSSQRMTSGQGWACLRPYSQKITQFEKFSRNPAAQQNQMRKFLTEGSLNVKS